VNRKNNTFPSLEILDSAWNSLALHREEWQLRCCSDGRGRGFQLAFLALDATSSETSS